MKEQNSYLLECARIFAAWNGPFVPAQQIKPTLPTNPKFSDSYIPICGKIIDKVYTHFGRTRVIESERLLRSLSGELLCPSLD